MSEGNLLQAEDVQGLENVLTDTSMPAVTRRNLLSKAAVGTAAVGAFGAFGPIPSALASNGTEFLVEFDVHVPDGTPASEVEQ